METNDTEDTDRYCVSASWLLAKMIADKRIKIDQQIIAEFSTRFFDMESSAEKVFAAIIDEHGNFKTVTFSTMAANKDGRCYRSQEYCDAWDFNKRGELFTQWLAAIIAEFGIMIKFTTEYTIGVSYVSFGWRPEAAIHNEGGKP